MTTGVLYIAFGDRYQAEARRSIRSLHESSPGLRVAVIADRAWTLAPRPEEFIIREADRSFGCKPRYMSESPFDRTLFLDTDTVVARDLRPVFGLLDWYDLGIRFLGPQLNADGGLEFHSQCNSGVVLYRKSEAVDRMFEAWKRLYEKQRERQEQEGRGVGPKGVHNQRSLSIALAKSDVRATHLETHLNFTLWQTIVTYSPPVIYHGKIEEMEGLDRVIAGGWDAHTDRRARLWLPSVRGLLPAGIRRSDPLLAAALFLRRAYNRGIYLLRSGLLGKGA